jgi:hypothetical protein
MRAQAAVLPRCPRRCLSYEDAELSLPRALLLALSPSLLALFARSTVAREVKASELPPPHFPVPTPNPVVFMGEKPNQD